MQSLERTNDAINFVGQEQAQAGSSGELTLLDAIDRILDKGMVINGDISIAIAGAELLTLKINLVIASLETAKRYGVELPWEKWNSDGNNPGSSNGFEIQDEFGRGGFGQNLLPMARNDTQYGAQVSARNPQSKGPRKKKGKSSRSRPRK